MTALPLRGEVWDAYLPVGEHPVLVVSSNAVNARLRHLAVLVLTGRPGPPASHLMLDADAGLTRYDTSYVDVTSIQGIPRNDAVQRRGLVSRSEMTRIEAALRVYLVLGAD